MSELDEVVKQGVEGFLEFLHQHGYFVYRNPSHDVVIAQDGSIASKEVLNQLIAKFLERR